MASHISSLSSSVTVRMRLDNSPRWLQLELALDGLWEGGGLIVYPDASLAKVRGADGLAASYDPHNWESGMMSGAFQAYRALNSPRRRVVVAGFRGSLSSEDMSAVAVATALGIATLLGAELPNLEVPGWRIVDLTLSKLSEAEDGSKD